MDPTLMLVGLVPFLLAWNNVANHSTAFQRWYVPVNLTLTAGLLAAARAFGVGWADLGLSTDRMGPGLALGAAVAGAVALGLLVAPHIPPARAFLGDARVHGLDARGLALWTLVRIPLGTVVLEEVVFRGVLLAVAAPVLGTGGAVALSSAVFGLWHVTPTLQALDANAVGRHRVVAVAGAVVFTGLAGVLFCGLRLWSGSLLAPMLVHVAANSLGAVAAWSWQRRHV
jgi:uncharacterized protein